MSKKIIELFKKYWYYAGAWHVESCNYIMSDEGVCNCQTGKNLKEIKSKLDTLLTDNQA